MEQKAASRIALEVVIAVIALGRKKELAARVFPHAAVVHSLGGADLIVCEAEIQKDVAAGMGDCKFHFRIGIQYPEGGQMTRLWLFS